MGASHMNVRFALFYLVFTYPHHAVHANSPTSRIVPFFGTSMFPSHQELPDVGLCQKSTGVASSGTVELVLFQNKHWNDGQLGQAYYVNMSVGTPPQPMTFFVDTGSSDLYVDDAWSRTCSAGHCVGGAFKANESSTWRDITPGGFSITYMDGSSATGDYITDVLTVGNLSLKDIQMGLNHDVNDGSQGLIGLDYPSLETADNKYMTLPGLLVSQGCINSRTYSLFLNDVDSPEGSLLFGGLDVSKYTGDLVTFNLAPHPSTSKVDDTIVILNAIDIRANGTTKHSYSAVDAADPAADERTLYWYLDSGTSVWTMPTPVFNDIIHAFGAENCTFGGRYGYVLPCPDSFDTEDSVMIYFGGDAAMRNVNISISLKQLAAPIFNTSTNLRIQYPARHGREATDACTLSISSAPWNTGDIFVLGGPVLRSMYLVTDFDNNQVSIAQARYDATESDIRVIPKGLGGVQCAVNSQKTQIVSTTLSVATSFVEPSRRASRTSGTFPTVSTAPVLPTLAGTTVSSDPLSRKNSADRVLPVGGLLALVVFTLITLAV
ncbi:hypothetical protein LTR28_003214 [Elasticomyces elasticus]|nr:hypothetical protein LTR28_003214 [Elasticomyces elasticus]